MEREEVRENPGQEEAVRGKSESVVCESAGEVGVGKEVYSGEGNGEEEGCQEGGNSGLGDGQEEDGEKRNGEERAGEERAGEERAGEERAGEEREGVEGEGVEGDKGEDRANEKGDGETGDGQEEGNGMDGADGVGDGDEEAEEERGGEKGDGEAGCNQDADSEEIREDQERVGEGGGSHEKGIGEEEGGSLLRCSVVPYESYTDDHPFSVTHSKPGGLKTTRFPGASLDLQHLSTPGTRPSSDHEGRHWQQSLTCTLRSEDGLLRMFQVKGRAPGHYSHLPPHPDLSRAGALWYQADMVDGQLISHLQWLSNEVALPVTSEMEAEEARLRSFGNWPSHATIQPIRLAQAGFFYTGHQDNVRCFHCDGGLRNWELGDDPWMEHAKWFPRCQYLLQVKGIDYINSIQELHSNILESTFISHPLQVFTIDEGTIQGDSEVLGEFFILHPLTTKGHSELSIDEPTAEVKGSDTVSGNAQLPPLMHSTVVQRALQMGFDGCMIEALVNSKYLLTGVQYGSVSELLSDLLEAEEEEGERRQPVTGTTKTIGTFPNPMEKELCSIGQLQSRVNLKSREGSRASNGRREPSAQEQGLSAEEQLRQLKNERTCKVCMDKDVCIVFLPCGHLVVCRECAPNLRRCPICRALIRGSVRAFMS
ncbi:baculoviral IAP repeat-containing protein 3-like [Leucoraja erinacea]|uniref:baculoviral IAP repeat-containing protein 3-like n=1 Tax=Leucoraja erinaceus TaxID=7782 RepID=UPI002456BC56|nr:baculoviral IAP repeat-containing protein 3-like [Leucoraja erinacea]